MEWDLHQVNGCTDPVRQCRIVAGERNMTVVAAPFGNGLENWEANARLIASAPDLLADLAKSRASEAELLKVLTKANSVMDAVSYLIASELGRVSSAPHSPKKCSCSQFKGQGSCIHSSLRDAIVKARAAISRAASPGLGKEGAE